MWLNLVPSIVALGVFVIMLASMEAGRRLALAHDRHEESEIIKGTAAVEGMMYALLGLLIALLFTTAASRVVDRRDLIVSESNAVGTAYLRLDLIPAEAQPRLRQAFRDYVDARLRGYELMPDSSYKAEFERAAALQKQIWRDAVNAAQASANPMTLQLLLDPINDMIDITSTRNAAILTHPPVVVYLLLVLLAMLCSLMTGRTMASRRFGKWLYRLGFAGVVSFAILVILELEFPRIGFLQINAFDQFLRQTRSAMD
jgi:hypothetical protein